MFGSRSGFLNDPALTHCAKRSQRNDIFSWTCSLLSYTSFLIPLLTPFLTDHAHSVVFSSGLHAIAKDLILLLILFANNLPHFSVVPLLKRSMTVVDLLALAAHGGMLPLSTLWSLMRSSASSGRFGA